MSKRSSHNINHPTHLWLQPVSFDPDAYREFAGRMDDSLAELVSKHRTRRTHFTRPITFLFGQADVTALGEDVLPEEDCW